MIYITGDIHGEFARLDFYLKSLKNCSALICCGDFGFWPNFPFYKKIELLTKYDFNIYWCDGNHEDHYSLKNKISFSSTKNIIQIEKNIFYIPRGNAIKIEDKSFLFFGGANSIDKKLRTPGLDWFPEENISNRDIMNLPKIDVDVMITHTCPKEVNLRNYNMTEKETDSNRIYLSMLFEKYNPKIWYFGHWHEYIEQKIRNTQFYGLNMIANKGWITKYKDELNV